MPIELRKINEHIRNLRVVMQSFETIPKSRQYRLENINGLIAKLFHELPQIHDRDGYEALKIRNRGYQLVKDIEKRLKEYGLVIGADGMSRRGRGWGGLRNSKLAVEKLEAVKKYEVVVVVEEKKEKKEKKKEEEGRLRRSKRIAEKEGQVVGDNETEKETKEVDIENRSDDNDSIITLVVDRRRQAEDSWVEMGMCLKDELLWYDPSNDFDESLLP